MRALTVQQPWCSATSAGAKRTENRSGGVTTWRGDVALHAGLAWSPDAASDPLIRAWFAAAHGIPAADLPDGPVPRSPDLFPFGAVVAVARLADCHRIRVLDDQVVCCTDPWALARFAGRTVRTHTVWADVRPLPEPVRARGALGWWLLSDTATSAVLDQLTAHPVSDPR